MAQSKDPQATITEARARPKFPPGVTLDVHGSGFRLRAYAGVSPVTGKPDHVRDRAALTIGARELAELALDVAARATALKATRRHRRKEGGHAPVPEVGGKPVERTCRAALELWWKAHAQHLASAAKHRQNIDCHLLPNVGDVALWRLRDAIDDDEAGSDPDLFDVGAFYARLRKEGAVGHPGAGTLDGKQKRTGAGAALAASTVESVHGTWRAALNFVARKDGWLPNGNPLAGMTVGGQAAGALDVIPLEEEVAALVPWLVDDRLEVAGAVLLVGGGLRPTEVAAVRWQLLDFDTGVLSLRGEGVVKTSGRGEPERWALVTEPSDKRRPRSLHLDPTTVEVLRRLWIQRRERALMCGYTLSRRAFVFSDAPDGLEHLTPHSIGTAFTRALARARAGTKRRPGARTAPAGQAPGGLALPAGMTLYSMRHYGITHALRRRVSVAEVARRFGTSKRMINERYDHSVPGEDAQAAAAMAAIWGPLDQVAGEVIPLRG